MTISIITINYRSKEYLKNFLASVYTHLISTPGTEFDFEVIVVNNEEKSLKLDFPLPFQPTIINHNRNIGFGAANNLAARQAKGAWLFFLNPDVELQDANLLGMFRYFSKHPEVGAIGPKIMLSTQNRPQPWTCGNKVSLPQILFRNSLKKPWNSRTITKVQWVSGTALLIRKPDFLAMGGFDEKFFMYFEDQDLCLRLGKTEKKIIFYPDASIIHFDGKSWNSFRDKKTSFYVSQDYFFLKHHGLVQLWLLKLLRLPIMLMLKLK